MAWVAFFCGIIFGALGVIVTIGLVRFVGADDELRLSQREKDETEYEAKLKAERDELFERSSS